MLENNKGLTLHIETWEYHIDGLSFIDVNVFHVIKILDNSDRHCWASNEYISEILNISITSVKNSIRKLRKMGYIHSSCHPNDRGTERNITVIRDLGQNMSEGEGTICPKDGTEYASNNIKDTVIEDNIEYFKLSSLTEDDTFSSSDRLKDLRDKFEQDEFSWEAVDNQINLCCRNLNITNDELLTGIKYTFKCYYHFYEDRFHRHHPKISVKAMTNAIQRLCDFEDEQCGQVIYEPEDMLILIHKHFDTEYREYTDYNICHFATNGILQMHTYKLCV